MSRSTPSGSKSGNLLILAPLFVTSFLTFLLTWRPFLIQTLFLSSMTLKRGIPRLSPRTIWLSLLQRPPAYVQSYSWNTCPLSLIQEASWDIDLALIEGKVIFASSTSASSLAMYSLTCSLSPLLESDHTPYILYQTLQFFGAFIFASFSPHSTLSQNFVNFIIFLSSFQQLSPFTF